MTNGVYKYLVIVQAYFIAVDKYMGCTLYVYIRYTPWDICKWTTLLFAYAISQYIIITKSYLLQSLSPNGPIMYPLLSTDEYTDSLPHSTEPWANDGIGTTPTKEVIDLLSPPVSLIYLNLFSSLGEFPLSIAKIITSFQM